jgi:hypothetical protein
LGPNIPLDRVAIDVETTVMEKACEIGPPADAVSDRLGLFGFARDTLEFGFPALEQLGHDRGRGRASHSRRPCCEYDVLPSSFKSIVLPIVPTWVGRLRRVRRTLSTDHIGIP